MKAKIILEDGQVFEGERIGSQRDVICEMVFNTAVTGYVELMTDPSYAGQGVVMSSPIIGNYGVFEKDFESSRPWLSAFIVRYLTPLMNDPRNAQDLDAFLKQYDIPGVLGADTRLLTLTIREEGTMMGMITGEENFNLEDCLAKIKEFKYISEVPNVSTPEKRLYNHESLSSNLRNAAFEPKNITKGSGKDGRFKVALMDFGAKANIRRLLLTHNCDVTVYPYDTPASDIIRDDPDGIMLSNGPGDPKDCAGVIEQLKILYKTDIPIFGICLGHQLMALATGFDTHKLKYGHRGVNHPVKDLDIDRCFITSQNHSYCVTESSIDPAIARVSHININDSSIEGLTYCGKDIFTVQFHPEGAPGPMDTVFLFERFTDMMARRLETKNTEARIS